MDFPTSECSTFWIKIIIYNNSISLAIINDICIIDHTPSYFLYFWKNKKRNKKYITLDNFQKYKKYGEVSSKINKALIIANDKLLLYIIFSCLRSNLMNKSLRVGGENKKIFVISFYVLDYFLNKKILYTIIAYH